MKNPMQANIINVVGVHTTIEADYEVNVALTITQAYEVMNELEGTNFINLDILPVQTAERLAIYAGLIAQLDGENGKHYITIDPLYSPELIDYINAKKP